MKLKYSLIYLNSVDCLKLEVKDFALSKLLELQEQMKELETIGVGVINIPNIFEVTHCKISGATFDKIENSQLKITEIEIFSDRIEMVITIDNEKINVLVPPISQFITHC